MIEKLDIPNLQGKNKDKLFEKINEIIELVNSDHKMLLYLRDLKEDDFGYALWLVKEKIKKLQSPESTTDVQDSVSKDTNTQRNGCGISLKIYIGDRRMYCGEIDPITNHKVLCEKCQGKMQ